MWNAFLYLSAIGFWTIIAIAIYRARKQEKVNELNTKVVTDEQVSAVLKNETTGEKIRIQ